MSTYQCKGESCKLSGEPQCCAYCPKLKECSSRQEGEMCIDALYWLRHQKPVECQYLCTKGETEK